MTTQTAPGSDFIKQLGRMYGTYTGGFIGFIILLAIFEQVGVPNEFSAISSCFSRWRFTPSSA